MHAAAISLVIANVFSAVQAVVYIGHAGDRHCVCYDARTLEAYLGGQVQDCQHPLGRLSALSSFTDSQIGDGNLGPRNFYCGRAPAPAYSHICCDTCTRHGCDQVMMPQMLGQSFEDPVRMPEEWKAWSAQNPANMKHNYKPSPSQPPSSSSFSKTSTSPTILSTAQTVLAYSTILRSESSEVPQDNPDTPTNAAQQHSASTKADSPSSPSQETAPSEASSITSERGAQPSTRTGPRPVTADTPYQVVTGDLSLKISDGQRHASRSRLSVHVSTCWVLAALSFLLLY